MKEKYSLIYLTTECCSPEQMIRIAAETGYDCIDARTIPMGLPGEKPFDLSKDRHLLEAARRAAAETGVWVDSIENARIFDGMSVKDYEPCLAAAAELGVRHVLSNVWSADAGYAREKFGELCDLAAEYGQQIDLEFVTWSKVKDLREAKNLLEAVKRPNAGILVDTLHFHRSRVTFKELEELPEEWLYCLHICDAPGEIPEDPDALAYTAREARLYPGEGGIDIRKIAGRKPWAVYGIEIPHRRRWEEMGYVKYAAEALRRTKAYLKGEEEK